MIIDLNESGYIRVNKEYTYRLLHGELAEKTYQIVVQCELADFITLTENFTQIESIEFLNSDGETPSSFSTEYSKANRFMVLSDVVDIEGNSIPAVQFILHQTDLETLVNKLNKQLNPVIDYEAMTLEEYAAITKEKIGMACTEAIYAGVDVETSYGTEHFSATEEDQLNIKALCDIALSTKQSLPYHADGTQCKIYTYQ